MPIKKSLLLVLALTACSITLLVSSFSKTASVACPTGKCCQQKNSANQSASPRDMMTQGMFHLST